ncbi:hypothetical protein SP19_96 [Salmonella phage 19]|nr:hypothetical protein SP19_96 [Salmonella phage 19]
MGDAEPVKIVHGISATLSGLNDFLQRPTIFARCHGLLVKRFMTTLMMPLFAEVLYATLVKV